MASKTHSISANAQVRSNPSKQQTGFLLMASNLLSRRFLVIIPLVIIWEIVGRMGVGNALPPFTMVLETFLKGLFTLSGVGPYGGPSDVPVLLYQSGSSLIRVGAGFALAALVGVPLGFAMGYFKTFNSNMDPLVSTLRPIPPIAWIPLAILWFGLGMKPTIFIIFIGTLFPIILNTQEGVRSASKRLTEFALVLGATRTQILRKVIVYEAFPSVITGMRIGFGIGWMSVVAAEMIAAKSGLGYLVMTARWVFATDMVLAGMLVIGLIGFGGDLLLRTIEAKFMRWRAGMVVS